jgi:hypothetical protein
VLQAKARALLIALVQLQGGTVSPGIGSGFNLSEDNEYLTYQTRLYNTLIVRLMVVVVTARARLGQTVRVDVLLLLRCIHFFFVHKEGIFIY